MKVVLPQIGIVGLVVFGTALLFLAPEDRGRAQTPKALRIGVIATTFPEQLSGTKEAFVLPFNSLIQNQTGIASQSTIVKDVWEMEKMLEAGTFQFGVLNGFEFAWLQEKHPNLKPLVITVIRKHPWPVAHLVTRQDAHIERFADLKGKTVGLPLGSRAHVRLYARREAEKVQGLTLQRPPNIEDALDDVVSGKTTAVVVDEASLKAYQAIKPGCYRKLAVVQSSPTFPAGVVIYKEGVLGQELLHRFQSGLLAAHKNSRDQLLMNLFRLSSFDPIPDEYHQRLSEIRKVYPAPAKAP